MKGFKIGHINIRSLVKNIDQLRIYLSNKKYNILSVNETMLDSSIPNDEININGYDIVRKDRNRNGGGVALYIRSVIDYKIRNDLMNESLKQSRLRSALQRQNHSLSIPGIVRQMLLLNVSTGMKIVL